MPSPARNLTVPRTVAAVATAALTCTLAVTPLTAASAAIVADPVTLSAPEAAIALEPVGSFETGVFDESAAEIVHAHGDRLFVVNAQAGSVDVLDYSDPTSITKLYEISSNGVANSVAVRGDGLGVIAFEAETKTDPGTLVFFDADAATPTVLGQVTVGALPDMVDISADGRYAVVANEGEPADDFSSDPEGSVGIVTLPSTKTAPAGAAVRTATFHAFEGANLPDGVRVFGPDVAAPGTAPGDNRVSRNLEPEYIAIDGGTAYAALQEANAIAVVDLATATVTEIMPLGFKDHGAPGNGLDVSDRDGAIDIRTYPGLYGIYMPDGMNAYSAGADTYLVTANEGDGREWGEFIDESRVKDLAVCADAPVSASAAALGRLNVVTDLGIAEGADCYSELFAYGARSFSIWNTDGTQVFDSGDDFEQITAEALPDHFNSGHDEVEFDSRSDAKGPEPENLAIGAVGDRTYAFVGLERVGGVMVYDITEPAASEFVTYVNNRDFAHSGEEAFASAGDLGAEGLAFISADESPTGEPMLAVGNEVSGTTTLFAIGEPDATPGTTEIQVLTVNDFHGRIEANFDNGEAGAAVLAGAVDHFEEQNPNTLFVSAGDSIGGSTFTSFIQDDEPTIEALVAAGLDLSVVGNHEFDRGFADLTGRVTDLYGSTDFTLGANVYTAGTTDPELPEYTVRTVDGVRVAFIGTVTQQTASMVSPDGIAGIEFGDQLEAANRAADEITAGDLADVIVLLTHEGSESDDCTDVATDATAYGELIRGASPAIDAIVSGHTHQSYNCTVPVEVPTLDAATARAGVQAAAAAAVQQRPVIQAHQYGTTLGKLDLVVDSATNELVSITGGLVPLAVEAADDDTPGYPLYDADPVVQAIVDRAVDVAEEEGAVEVGDITADITRGGTNGSDRGVESTLGNLVADVYLWAASNDAYAGEPADIGVMNPGGLRADLRYGTDGTMTYRDVADVQPFANTLVTVDLTGAQLKAVLEEQWQPAGSSRPKLHLGISEGFSYEYDANAARGERIVRMQLNGQPIDPAAVYTVVTNSFVAAGGDNFTTFREGAARTDTGQVDLAATVAYFAAATGPVEPAPLGRAIAVDAGTPVDPGTGGTGTGGTGTGGTGTGGTGTGGTGSGSAAGTDRGQLATTGGTAPFGIALAAAFAVVAGGLLMVLRRRPVRS